jgi:ribosomal protein L37AE/L43A
MKDTHNKDSVHCILACPKCHSNQVEEIGIDVVRCNMCDENFTLDEAVEEGKRWDDVATQKGY